MATKFYFGDKPLLSQPSLGGGKMGRAYIGGTQVYGGPAYDADAILFFDAVEGGGDTLTDTQKDAVNQLVVDLKAVSLWTPMVSIYPYVGGTATAHKWNLKDPRDLDAAYRITWGSTVNHGVLGVKGTSRDNNSYGDTHYNPFIQGDTGFTAGVYINDGLGPTPANVYDWGAYDGTNDNMISFGFNNKTTMYAAFDGTTYINTTGGTYTNSFFAGSNDGTNTTIWQNGSSLTTSAQLYDPTNLSYAMLASNRTPVTSAETGRGHGIAIMANSGFDATQMSNLNTAISTYVTALSRN